MGIKYDLVALKRLYKDYNCSQTKLAQWLGVSRQYISDRINSKDDSKVSWECETLDDDEINILLNLIKNGKTFYKNDEEKLIAHILRNKRDKSYAFFIKKHDRIKCMFELTGKINDQLSSIGFFKYGLFGVRLNEQLSKICKVDDSGDLPTVLIEDDNLYLEVINQACDSKMTNIQYVESLGFTLLNIDKEVKPTPFEQMKINTRTEYISILQKYYLVTGNQVYIKSSDPFNKRLRGNAFRQNLTLNQLVDELGFKMISKKHLPSDYIPYNWVKGIEGAFDEDDYQSAVGCVITSGVRETNNDDSFIFSESDYEKAVKLFDPHKPLDHDAKGYSRGEQPLLRKYLFGKQEFGVCGICGKEYHVSLMVTAHIKRRASCTSEEKLDYRNIVIPMCKFGCDDLYEKGYITVVDGTVELIEFNIHSKAMLEYFNTIVGRECPFWNDKSKTYFEWHRKDHIERLKHYAEEEN